MLGLFGFGKLWSPFNIEARLKKKRDKTTRSLKTQQNIKEWNTSRLGISQFWQGTKFEIKQIRI